MYSCWARSHWGLGHLAKPHLITATVHSNYQPANTGMPTVFPEQEDAQEYKIHTVWGRVFIWITQGRLAHYHLISVDQSLHDSQVEFAQVKYDSTNTTVTTTSPYLSAMISMERRMFPSQWHGPKQTGPWLLWYREGQCKSSGFFFNVISSNFTEELHSYWTVVNIWSMGMLK